MSRVFCQDCGDPIERFAAVPMKKRIPEKIEKIGRKTTIIPAYEENVWICMDCYEKRKNRNGV